MALDAEAELARNRIDPRYRADTETRGELASVFTLSGNAYELLSQALAANTAPNIDPAIVLSSSQQSRRQAEILRTERRDERQRVQLTLAEQARQLSERLAREIAAMEAAFETDNGDAWREHIANRVMDPDEIPQRRPYESMQDYRQRLETVLIATMIDENGNIRPEYANSDDPDVRRYADWAHSKHRKNEIDSAPQSELEEILAKPANRSDLNFLAQSSVRGDPNGQGAELSDAADRQREDAASASSAELDGFLLGN